jgi:AcrR family transcriptional regulator
MSKAKQSQASREKLLAAAEVVILEKGVVHLTLDAVAATAGISKGGLLYHFASKEALVVALVETLVASLEEDFEKAYAAEREGPGRAARAMIAEGMSWTDHGCDERRERLGAALLAAAGNKPELLLPMQRAFTKWIQEMGDDGLAPGVAMVVAAALDGLTFWHLFGLHTPSQSAHRDMIAALKRFTETKS